MKFAGGREAEGILKGYDPLLNLVLDNTKEYLRGNVWLIIIYHLIYEVDYDYNFISCYFKHLLNASLCIYFDKSINKYVILL